MPVLHKVASGLIRCKTSTFSKLDAPASQGCMRESSVELSPLLWWRTRRPEDLSYRDVRTVRSVLLRTDPIEDYDWSQALGGNPAAAIGVAIRVLKLHGMTNPLTDIAVSAVLCCFLEDDHASIALITSALRRRTKIDPRCHDLCLLWRSV